ncbi:hypothetical protein ACFL60_02225 [Candidatus Omnitrophota bacterium]
MKYEKGTGAAADFCNHLIFSQQVFPAAGLFTDVDIDGLKAGYKKIKRQIYETKRHTIPFTCLSRRHDNMFP